MSEANLVAVAVTGLVFGPPAAIWPYKLARWEEVLDAIGRQPAGPVEPAEWKVLLTRVMGVGFTLAGVAALVTLLT